ncbi:uncharacterized protein LOC143361047 isoform X2 [Halictus rubicundus]|uniref:uncharacterized protein LOC143361047 isoform X2 n=1 Tax=Halictus rubicundus TaxID=77578 RepID=UPI004035A67B
MAALDTHYKLSTRLLTILGLWPYVNVHFRRIQSIVVNSVCSLLVVVQITPMTHDDVDLFVILQSLSLAIMILGSIVKFNSIMTKIGTIRIVMDSIKSKWNTRHEDTLKILEKRAILGKQQGAIYAIFIYPSSLLLMVFRTASYVLLVTAPPNSNLTDPFPVVTDYLIDEEKYFFLIIVHQNLTFFFMATIYVATETLFIMWLQHSIGLLELASYHIEKGISERPAHISEKLMDAYRMKCLATAVTYHKDAKAFLMYMKKKFSFSYAVLLVFAVISLAINFFRLSTAICKTHDIEEMVLSFLFSTSELVYMFYLNYVVQQILDYSDNFSTLIYSTPWYNRSVSIQKSLLIIMIRCSEPLIFDFYGFYNASVEGFSGVCNY